MPDAPDTTDRQVRSQYEAYPYPARDPREEPRRLIQGSPSWLIEVDHWVFGAARPAARHLEALVAGGGTGDATIMLAQHLASAGRPGRVTWLDRSTAAGAIARQRAAARRLDNIAWQQADLLDLPGSGLGPFDYIDCCGVLHHLPDPAAGLRALVSVLAPGGGIGLMVYAPHGRTGVYMVQDALRLLAPPDQPPAARVEVARRVLKHLPETNWLCRNQLLSDHTEGGDAGLYDLLLHPRDRAFTVPALADLVDQAGLRIAALIEPVRYDPALYLPDPRLRARAAELGPVARAALAEALAGNMGVHIAYCVRAADPPPALDPMAPLARPVLRGLTPEDAVRSVRADRTIAVSFDGFRTTLALPRLAPALLALVDGRRTVGDILEAAAARGVAPEVAAREWRALWDALNPLNRLLLAAP
jgi:SAM-dependent methyltransferase